MLYRTSEFAKRASVSVRTLQFYDKLGLLSPSNYSEVGHRQYCDEDLLKLQRILVFKFLGFSLTEIKGLIDCGPHDILDTLVAQKTMIVEKRNQADAMIRAIDGISRMLSQTENTVDYDVIAKIIEVIQMDLKLEWTSQFLTPEQQSVIRDIATQSYSEEALRTFSTQEFAEQTFQQYRDFREELKRLVTANVDPSSVEAQNLARCLHDLNKRRSEGDPEVVAGMKRAWESFNALPDAQKPSIYAWTSEEQAFMKKACTTFYTQNRVE